MEERLQNYKLPYLTQEELKDLYKDYLRPRDKILALVRKGDLIPIKRELYLIGEKYKKLYSKEALANIIYGPSAISFEYALSFHGLIPERVEAVTSVCFKRNKEFRTPIGAFTYRYISQEMFPIGIELHISELGNFIMATPEKALCDVVYFQKLKKEEILEFVIENMRIDEEDFFKLNSELLHQIAAVYKRQSVANLVHVQIIEKGK
ncbi:MAG: hypothetical protein ACLGHN_01455 [Bacteriovoracia bacterium]